MSNSFEALGLKPALLQTLDELGYAEPTPIQNEAIPPLLEGQDVMGQAQTGTGKTAAFTLPMLQHLEPTYLQTLILTPTRELAVQVAEAVYRYGNQLGVRVLPIYGKQSYDRQIRRLKKGVHVVVGTPGRTLDLIHKNELDLSKVRYLVLDEADEMLKMGFIDDVEEILSATDPDVRQTALFSATFPNEIKRLGKKYMRNPQFIAIETEEMTVENVEQRYYMVNHKEKVAALSRLLEVEELQNTLIFARTRSGAAQLAETLVGRGYPVAAIHGDLLQDERERVLRRFRNGQLTILVATDVVARGVDIPAVSHVINFDIPQLPIEYVHRIGRTGRAGRGGDAITLITPRERNQLRRIEDYTRKRIRKGKLPSRDVILHQRDQQFKQTIVDAIQSNHIADEIPVLEQLVDMGYDPEQVATAAMKLLRANEEQRPLEDIHEAREQRRYNDDKPRRRKRSRDGQEAGMVKLSMNLGKANGIKPGDVVYNVASAAGIPGRVLGAIDIRERETYVDVPEAHVDQVIRGMKRAKIKGKSVRVARARGGRRR